MLCMCVRVQMWRSGFVLASKNEECPIARTAALVAPWLLAVLLTGVSGDRK